MPTEMISEIVQDNEGLIWFNTSLGIFYSNGFFTYPIPDSIQGKLSSLVNLTVDKDGIVWINNKLENQKVFSYYRNTWKEINVPDLALMDKKRNYFRFSVDRLEDREFQFFIGEEHIVFGSPDNNTWVEFPYTYDELGEFFSLQAETPFIFFNKGTLLFQGNLMQFKLKEYPFHLRFKMLPLMINKVCTIFGKIFLQLVNRHSSGIDNNGRICQRYFQRLTSAPQVFESDIYFTFNSNYINTIQGLGYFGNTHTTF